MSKRSLQYVKEKPSCCGKVVTSQELTHSGQVFADSHVFMCCGCGKVLGRYNNYGSGPDDLIRVSTSEDSFYQKAAQEKYLTKTG